MAVVIVIVANATCTCSIVVGRAIFIGVATIIRLVGHAMVELLNIAARECQVGILHKNNQALEIVVVILSSLSSGSLSGFIDRSALEFTLTSLHVTNHALGDALQEAGFINSAGAFIMDDYFAWHQVAIFFKGINVVASCVSHDGVVINCCLIVKEFITNDFDHDFCAIGLSRLNGVWHRWDCMSRKRD